MQMEIFQTTRAVTFWQFIVFQCRSNLPKSKRELISSIINVVYELPHKLPNDLGLRNLGKKGKIRRISELREDTA